jgi:hypothetical protein
MAFMPRQQQPRSLTRQPMTNNIDTRVALLEQQGSTIVTALTGIFQKLDKLDSKIDTIFVSSSSNFLKIPASAVTMVVPCCSNSATLVSIVLVIVNCQLMVDLKPWNNKQDRSKGVSIKGYSFVTGPGFASLSLFESFILAVFNELYEVSGRGTGAESLPTR